MTSSKITFLRIMANVALFVPSVFGLYVAFLATSRFSTPAGVFDIQLATPLPVHPGQVIEVHFKVQRKRTCPIEISRIMDRKEDQREFQISFSNQLIEATPGIIQSSYRMTIPREMTAGTYWLYSRYRYFCNGLDNWVPYVRKTEAIKIEVAP